MKITVIGRQMNVYDEMKELVEKRIDKKDENFTSIYQTEKT